MPAETTRVSVVIPTYRRPELLRKCLDGIRGQNRAPDEVIVVHREDEPGVERELTGIPGGVAVTVTEAGVLAAMNAGVAASTGQVVAFIDDDAVAHPSWLAQLLGHFDDATVGGVGGRDVVHSLPDPSQVTGGDVGIITPWGKLVGNHHLGSGPSREAMVLKAVNMAYRRDALALPRTLRGAGAQVHFEVASGLWARQRGWRLIYDPAILVDHYPGPRFDADRRERPDPIAARDAAYNLVTCIVGIERRLGVRRAVFGLVVGDAMTPGLVRAAVGGVQRDWPVVRRFIPSLRGQTVALFHQLTGRSLEMVPAPRVVPR